MSRTTLVIAAILVASFIFYQWKPVATPEPAPPTLVAEVARPAINPARPVDEQNSIRVLLASGLETSLVSPFSGRIRDVSVSLGQSFSKGKTLISFDCDEPIARMQMAEAELGSARETHEAKLRMQGLQQAGEVEVSLAASVAERARAQVALYRAQLAQCTVSAPFSGRVVKIAVKSHQGVTQGQALLELVSSGSLKLRLNAPAKWLGWLKVGTNFDVAVDETGRSYPARVSAINARVDAVSQSVELEAMIEGAAPDLLPGMSGVARFNPPR